MKTAFFYASKKMAKNKLEECKLKANECAGEINGYIKSIKSDTDFIPLQKTYALDHVVEIGRGLIKIKSSTSDMEYASLLCSLTEIPCDYEECVDMAKRMPSNDSILALDDSGKNTCLNPSVDIDIEREFGLLFPDYDYEIRLRSNTEKLKEEEAAIIHRIDILLMEEERIASSNEASWRKLKENIYAFGDEIEAKISALAVEG